jgi:hypothetical protein
MRSFAPAQFTIQDFGHWRAALGLLALLSVVTLVAWFFARPAPRDVLAWLMLATAILALVVWPIWPLANPAPVSLRWDARCWHLGPVDGVGCEPERGELSVAIDLGHWMLLRFTPAQAPAGRRPTWLPVQRAGLEAQWHALRCALHSPRPAAGPDATPDATPDA